MDDMPDKRIGCGVSQQPVPSVNTFVPPNCTAVACFCTSQPEYNYLIAVSKQGEVNPSEAATPATPRRSPSHCGFSDESHHTHGRYRGVGMVSLAEADHASLDAELANILTGCDLKEFKWKDLSSARHRFAALKMIEWTFPKLVQHTIRIDVLLWDTEDSRHKIRGRDDVANLSRM